MYRNMRGTIAWMLVLVMTLSPLMAYAQPPAAAQQPPVQASAKIDLGYVTPETAAAVVLFPRRVLTAPEAELLPLEVLAAVGKRDLGFDPLEIEQILAIAEPPTFGPPGVAVVARLAGPLPEGKILGKLWDRTTESTSAGKTYRKAAGPMDLSICRIDDRTLLVGTDAMLSKVLANHAAPKEGKMAAALGRLAEPPDALAVLLFEPLRPLIAMPLAMAPLPPQLADVKTIPDLLNSLDARVNLHGDFSMSLSLRANDEAAAQQIEKILDDVQAFVRQQIKTEAAKLAASSDPVEQAIGKYQIRLSDRMSRGIRPARQGETWTLAAGGQNAQLTAVAATGVLVALLLPAVQAAREAARRATSTNNLKQIGLAMHNYHDSKRQFPARAIFDKQGKPLLSWRVQVLPFLEEGRLYQEFHLDEPWDSDHNRQLIPKMPALFKNPSGAAAPGKANYLAVVGPGLAFEGDKGRSLAAFRDGAAHTVMVLEVNDDRAVEWTKPDDWQYDAEHPMAGLGQAHPAGFEVLFADGSVRCLTKDINPKVFHGLLTIAGGEPWPQL